jgi:hypothetical protein
MAIQKLKMGLELTYWLAKRGSADPLPLGYSKG